MSLDREVDRIADEIWREYTQLLRRQTDHLPFIGGVLANQYQDVPLNTINMTAAYVEPQHLPQVLSMSNEDVAALMADQDTHRTDYRRGRFLIMEGAWVDVVMADDHEPSLDDTRWMLANVAECVVVALSGGYTTPIGIAQRVMGRLRGSLELGRFVASPAGNTATMTEWNANRPFAAGFVRVEPPAARGSWQQFFEGLDTEMSSDTWSAEGVADICWRCDARNADDDLGLCAHCREDLNPTDE